MKSTMLKALIILISFLICSKISGQEKGTFRGYSHMGFNTNQILGDSISGFNYWALRGGVGAYFMITSRISANLEINYTMRGASGIAYDDFKNYLYHRTIHTNYIEMPIMINYHDGNIARFGVGPVFSSLISSAFWYNKKRLDNDTTRNLMRDFDLGIAFSVTFDIKKHFGANLRMTQSIIPINNRRKDEEDQYHSSLSASAIYYF